MKNKEYKRHHFLIKKGFQLKYTLLVLSMLLIVMLVSGAGIYIGMWGSIIENFSEFKVSQDLETAKRIAGYEDVRYTKGDYRLNRVFREAELLSEQQRQAISNALVAVNRSLVPKIIILAGIMFLAGIFISHKIAGPMYRFERSAEAVKEGNLKIHFKVRKNDEMKKTASVLESMVESLRSDISSIKKAKEELKIEIAKISNNNTVNLKNILKKIETVLSKYLT